MKKSHVVPPNEIKGASAQVGTKPPHRILVVDDDKEIRQLNSQALLGSGFHVDVAEDGAAAWETLQLNNYHLLITGNNMPKVTGVDLLKKLHAARRALPVIMATGILPEEELAKSPWLQPAATLIKPYTIDELLGTVRQVLQVTDGPREVINASANPPNLPSAEGWLL